MQLNQITVLGNSGVKITSNYSTITEIDSDHLQRTLPSWIRTRGCRAAGPPTSITGLLPRRLGAASSVAAPLGVAVLSVAAGLSLHRSITAATGRDDLQILWLPSGALPCARLWIHRSTLLVRYTAPSGFGFSMEDLQNTTTPITR